MLWFFDLSDKDKIRVILSLFSYRSFQDCIKSEIEYLLSRFIGVDIEIKIPTFSPVQVRPNNSIPLAEKEEKLDLPNVICLVISNTHYRFDFGRSTGYFGEANIDLINLRNCYNLKGMKFYEKLLYKPDVIKSANKRN